MPQSGVTDKLFYSTEIAAIIRRFCCTERNKNGTGGFLLTGNPFSLYPLACSGPGSRCGPEVYTQTLTTRDFSSAQQSLHIIHPRICLSLPAFSLNETFPSWEVLCSVFCTKPQWRGLWQRGRGSCFGWNCYLLLLCPVTVYHGVIGIN